MFENVIKQNKNIISNHEERLVATAAKGLRKELIFKAAVAFEEFAQRYGYYHLSESKPDINKTNSKLCEWKLCNLPTQQIGVLQQNVPWKP